MKSRGLAGQVLALLLASLLVCLSAQSARAAGNCSAGGAPRPDEGGIGGTGVRGEHGDDEGGIGGTGITAADTGVIGTITGFASICVGGTEIFYDNKTPVEIDGQPASVAALAVGQVVEVVAKDNAAELRAQRIASRHIVAGPITAVGAGDGMIGVLGQRVLLSESTRIDGGSLPGAELLALHATVQVSGMRRGDGVIVASRVNAYAASAPVRLSGWLSKADATNLQIGGVPVRGSANLSAAAGSEVRVVGRWDGHAVVAESVEAVPTIPFDGRVARLDIEGYARAAAVSGSVYLGPFLVDLPKDVARRSIANFTEQGTRMRVQAIVSDHHVVAERVFAAPDLAPPGMPENPPLRSRPDDASSGKHEHGGGDHPAPPGPVDHGGTDHGPGGDFDHHEPPIGGAPADRPERHSFDLPGQNMPDRPDKPQRPELPYMPERPPRPERPLPPERPEMHGHQGR